MRPTSKPPFDAPTPPVQHTELPVQRASLALGQHRHGGDPSWPTPWAAAGLPEPGWWNAFVVDKNLVLTRTPDHPGRTLQQEPKQKESDLNRRSPISKRHSSESIQPSAVPTVEQLLSPPQSRPQPDPAVHHQLAQIQAEFGSKPEDMTALDNQSEGGTPTAAASAEPAPSAEAPEASEAEVGAFHHNEGVTPDSFVSRFQNTYWTAPVGLSFSWQTSSWQAGASAVQPIVSDNPPTSAITEDGPSSIHGTEANEFIEEAVFVETEEPSIGCEAASAAPVDIKVVDPDPGYLALYPDEFCSVIQTLAEPTSTTAKAGSAVAPADKPR